MTNTSSKQKGHVGGYKKAVFSPHRGANLYSHGGYMSRYFYSPDKSKVKVDVEMDLIARAVWDYRKILRVTTNNTDYIQELNRFRDFVLVSLKKIEEAAKSLQVIDTANNNNNNHVGDKQ